jgi:hypothetical protein
MLLVLVGSFLGSVSYLEDGGDEFSSSLDPRFKPRTRHRLSGLTFVLVFLSSCGTAVDIAIGYGLYGRGFGVGVPVRSGMFTSPYRPDRLWGPPSLLSIENREGRDFFPGVKAAVA